MDMENVREMISFSKNLIFISWSFEVRFSYEVQNSLGFIILLAQPNRYWDDRSEFRLPDWNLIWVLKSRWEFDTRMY